tara:strand:- start:465 stop:728 length:264 start_codon:yes stop_codon:yes gene_type:complete
MTTNIPQRRTFITKEEALKAESKINKSYKKRNTSHLGGSKAEAQSIYCYETQLFYVLLGYEMDEDNSRCILDYDECEISWNWVSMIF